MLLSWSIWFSVAHCGTETDLRIHVFALESIWMADSQFHTRMEKFMNMKTKLELCSVLHALCQYFWSYIEKDTEFRMQMKTITHKKYRYWGKNDLHINHLSTNINRYWCWFIDENHFFIYIHRHRHISTGFISLNVNGIFYNIVLLNNDFDMKFCWEFMNNDKQISSKWQVSYGYMHSNHNENDNNDSQKKKHM